MKSDYPVFEAKFENKEAESQMSFVFEVIKSVRNIRQSLNIAPSLEIGIEVYSENNETQIIDETQNYIKRMTKLSNIKINSTKKVPNQSATAIVGNTNIFVPLAGVIDIDSEILKQNKKLEKLQQEKQSLNGRLSNKKFVDNAPESVLVQTRERLSEIETQSKAIDELLESLG
jgi:valyl-tRNA synthetase